VKKFEKDEEGEDVIVAELDNSENGANLSLHLENLQILSQKRGTALGRGRVFPPVSRAAGFAVTIHKSQGKTFEKVVIDVGRGTFAHGQMYVALSRCTTLEGIVLKQPLKKNHILMDWQVVKFLTGIQYAKAALNLHPRRQAGDAGHRD